MKFSYTGKGTPDINIKDNIFSGIIGFESANPSKSESYGIYILPDGAYPKRSFDAYLPSDNAKLNPAGIKAYGVKNDDTPIKAEFKYSDSTYIFETCHGRKGDTGKEYNFYQAFYPMGYIAPPYGETTSISIIPSYYDVKEPEEEGGEGIKVIKVEESSTTFTLSNNAGGCSKMSITEYHDQYGILSKSAGNSSVASNELSPNISSPIHGPHEDCPPALTIGYYFDEFGLELSAGATGVGQGGNFFNHNPIPTSLDSYYLRLYDANKNESVPAEATFTGSSLTNQYNNRLCPLNLMEGETSQGKGLNELILQTDGFSELLDPINDSVSFAGFDNWNYWHLTFEENANSLPFSNNFVDSANPGRQINNSVSTRGGGEGTQVFKANIASEDYWWDNRQCAAPPDYLPWTFGGTINACPTDYFDIPYYSAIKKFGFYGTRFQHNCHYLNWENSTSLSKNPAFSQFDNLLKTAKDEEKHNNFYAGNRGFFYWVNYSQITGTSEYSILSNNPEFLVQSNGIVDRFNRVFGSVTGFISNVGAPQLKTSNGELISIGTRSDILFSDREYNLFRDNLDGKLDDAQQEALRQLEDDYTRYAVSGGKPYATFYDGLISGRESRLRTRYMENTVNGRSIDLFPMNHIIYGFDEAQSYTNASGWVFRSSTLGAASEIPRIDRRYFQGAYSRVGIVSGLAQELAKLNSYTGRFYPGFFNEMDCGSMLPKPQYQKINEEESTITDTRNNRQYSTNGWLTLGYNEIGQLDGNFSCFSPIFVQNPTDTVVKIGQRPTFRTYAVDYHTLPEDKINKRYPEIMYWAKNLKLTDGDGENLYPISYKWYRVWSGYLDRYLSGDFSAAEPANPSGDWCCMEGDTNTCTLIHPLECSPAYNPENPSEESYTYLQGARQEDFGEDEDYGDDKYFYFCLASGRFGVRSSDYAKLELDDFTLFDVSVRNGSTAAGAPVIKFIGEDYNGTEFTITPSTTTNLQAFGGFVADKYTIPETVVSQKRPPSNMAFCAGASSRFIGPWMYRGETRSYAPGVLTDTRGLNNIWGHILDYGKLVKYKINLKTKTGSKRNGELLYGHKHLPTCENFSMPQGKKGIKVDIKFGGFDVRNWAIEQLPYITDDSKIAVPYNRLTNIGELYPPIEKKDEEPNMGIGHWQFANNLGAIKRFGKNTVIADTDGNGKDSNALTWLSYVKNRVLRKTDLAGENCGYTKSSLGRNMIYYVEAFERFYIICDSIKKKNVTNKSFISPGARLGNSAIQYFWLGQPTDTFLSRHKMYGPYAYQWKVNRHNRDRNGNGISLGFYSMGHGTKYSLMYDGPAIYGLYLQDRVNIDQRIKSWVEETNRARRLIYGTNMADPSSIRYIYFGKSNSGCRGYGDIRVECQPPQGQPLTPDAVKVCSYISLGHSSVSHQPLSMLYCERPDLGRGACFDPCLSIRYQQGFLPGGKLLNLLSYKNSRTNKITRLTHDTNHIDVEKRELGRPDIRFRGPYSTPYKKQREEQLGESKDSSINPCRGGGADHCNYITATLDIGSSSYLVGTQSTYNNLRYASYQLLV